MANDLRVQKTFNAIHTTIKEMILEMDLDDITVQDLTKRAQIHRKTFYLHYSCIEDLFKELLEENIEDYIEYIKDVPADSDFKVFNRIYFEFMATREPYIEKLVCAPTYRELSDQLFISTRDYNRNRYNPYQSYSVYEQNIINTFLCVNSNNIYRQWIADHKSIPLEELIDLCEKLLCNGVNAIMNNNDINQ